MPKITFQGSDSGGSIRSPCHVCGIVGLKPTSGRLPLHGQALDGGFPGIPGVHNASGLITHSIEDLHYVHKCLLAEESVALVVNDPRFVPIPWKEPRQRPLVFGW